MQTVWHLKSYAIECKLNDCQNHMSVVQIVRKSYVRKLVCEDSCVNAMQILLGARNPMQLEYKSCALCRVNPM